MTRIAEQRAGVIVPWLAIEGEFEVTRQIFVPRVHARALGEVGELVDESVVECLGLPAVVAVARAGVEQRVAAEQRRLLGARQQTDMSHGVPGGVQAFELDGAPDLDHLAFGETAVDATDAPGRTRVREHLRLGSTLQPSVSAGMVAVLVGIEDLGDLPAMPHCRSEARAPLQRINRERLAGLRTGDE